MGKTKLMPGKLIRLPILLFTIVTPLLFILSIGAVFASESPIAIDDAYSTNEDTALITAAPGVLGNDEEVEVGDVALLETAPPTGTLNLALSGAFTYTPLLDFNGIITFSYYVSNTDGISDAAHVVITVTAVNDAPTAGNDHTTTLEDTAVSIPVLANDDDIDGSLVPASVTVVSQPVSGTTGINPTTGAITYTPTLNFNGNDSFVYQVFDNGSPTPTLPVTATVFLTVTAVNDAPVIDNSGSMTLDDIYEDTTNSGTLVGDIISSDGADRITDADAGAEEGLAIVGITDINGTWQYSLNGVSWTLFNTVSDSTAVLLDPTEIIRFVPDADYNGPAGPISFRAWDRTAGYSGQKNVDVSANGGTTPYSTAVETATLTVLNVNDAPFLDLNGGSSGSSFGTTFIEDAGPVTIVDTDLSISDLDDTDLTSARAVLTNPLNGTAETLTVDTGTTGITAVYSATTHILSLTGTVPLTTYQAVLRTLTYNNSSQDPDNTYLRNIEITVNDGTDDSNLTTSFVAINAINDDPILIKNDTLLVNENGSNTISVIYLQVTDVDNAASERIFTITSPPSHGDLLLINGPITTTLTTYSTFTQADIDNSRLDYQNDGSEFTSDSFTFTVADGSGGSIGATPFNIQVNENNDSPVLVTYPPILELDEGTTSTISSSQLMVTDADNTAVELTYRLEITPTHGNLLLNSVPLAANDSFTQADIDNNDLTYAHDGSETTSDSFTFAVEDGSGGTINSTLFAITINPVNDAPFVDLNGDAAGTHFAADFTEDGGPVTIADSTSIIADADNGSLQTATVTLANRPDETAESLSANTNGTGITANYNPAAGVLLLTGIDTINNYQKVLRSLQYNNTAQDPTVTNRTVNVTVHDGLASSNAATSTITIHAVNDPPALLKNSGLTVDFGQTGIINNTLLKIIDLDDSASELVYTVKSLPANGQLKRNGIPLALNSTFTQADINSGLLAYTHNKSNTESDSFQFTAVDSSGGSISQKTFAIVINPQPVVYLPVVLNNYVYSEPNDSACEAFGITFNKPYQFLPDDVEDWYEFSLASSSNVTIQMSNYAPMDGQMIVYASSDCAHITRIKQAADITPGASAILNRLPAGTYYVRVYTAVRLTNPPPYTLLVTKR